MESRALSIRKINAIRDHARRLGEEIASYWDEGPITYEIDRFFDAMQEFVIASMEAMDQELTRVSDVEAA